MSFIKKNIGIIILIVGVLGLVIYNWDKINISSVDDSPNEYSENIVNTNYITLEDNMIMIDIKGEVKSPGLYKINQDLRVGDAIKLAGGPTIYANLQNINLAEKLEDEMVIIVPKLVNQNEVVMIEVEIKGEVINPGIYSLYQNSNIQDLINSAGGITDLACMDNISLVQVLIENETIIIPKTIVLEDKATEERKIYVEIYGEINKPGIYLIPETYTLEDLIFMAGGVTSECDITKINWSIKLCLGAKILIPSYQDDNQNPSNSDKININTANLDELMSLPGIGQIIVQRIIDYRSEFGNFTSIEEIMLVSGIKDRVYEQIKDSITV